MWCIGDVFVWRATCACCANRYALRSLASSQLLNCWINDGIFVLGRLLLERDSRVFWKKMYMCLCAYTCTCLRKCTYKCLRMFMYTCKCLYRACIHSQMCVVFYDCTCVYVCVYRVYMELSWEPPVHEACWYQETFLVGLYAYVCMYLRVYARMRHTNTVYLHDIQS